MDTADDEEEKEDERAGGDVSEVSHDNYRTFIISCLAIHFNATFSN